MLGWKTFKCNFWAIEGMCGFLVQIYKNGFGFRLAHLVGGRGGEKDYTQLGL